MASCVYTNELSLTDKELNFIGHVFSMTAGTFVVVAFSFFLFEKLRTENQRERDIQRKLEFTDLSLGSISLVEMIDTLQFLISLLLAGLFIAGTYTESDLFLSVRFPLEITCMAVIFADYLLRLYLSPDKGHHVLKPNHIVDVVTLVPFIALAIDGRERGNAVRVLHVLRLLRLSRLDALFRERRMGIREVDPHRHLTLLMIHLVTQLLVMVVVAAGVFYCVENLGDAPDFVNGVELEFHEGFYIILIEMLGRTRLPLEKDSYLWYTVVCSLVLFSVIVIPVKLTQIYDMWVTHLPHTTRVRLLKDKDLVIVWGTFQPSQLSSILREIFPSTKDLTRLSHQILVVSCNKQGNMVSLSEYVQHLFVDNFKETDVDLRERMKVGKAKHAIVFPDGDDAIAMRRFLLLKTHNPSLMVHTLVQDTHVSEILATLPHFCAKDRVVSVNDWTSRTLSFTTACPGVNTLLVNLVTTNLGEDDTTEADAEEYRPKLRAATWRENYLYGMSADISSTTLHSGFHGWRYRDVIPFAYAMTNATIICARRGDVIISVLGEETVQKDDVVFFIAQQRGKADMSVLTPYDRGLTNATSFQLPSPRSPRPSKNNPRTEQYRVAKQAAREVELLCKDSLITVESQVPGFQPPLFPPRLKTCVLVLGLPPDPWSFLDSFFLADPSVEKQVRFLCTSPPGDAADISAHFDGVSFRQGSGDFEPDLFKAGISDCTHVLILHKNTAHNATVLSDMAAAMINRIVLRALDKSNRRNATHIITWLVNSDSVDYITASLHHTNASQQQQTSAGPRPAGRPSDLLSRQTGRNLNNSHMKEQANKVEKELFGGGDGQRQNARGSVFHSSFVNHMLARTVSNNDLVHVMSAMMFGLSTTENEHAALRLVEVPRHVVGQQYIVLLFHFLQHNAIPIAMYRHSPALEAPGYFVLTNPPPELLIGLRDYAIVLAPPTKDKLRLY